MPIERLEPRIALATGLTLTRLPLGALNIVATEGADFVYLRSDEPGFLTVGVGEGDLVIDGVIAPNPVAFAMPKGPVTVNMLGGDDQLLLKPMILPGSITVNDPSGKAETFIEGFVVKGAFTYNGSTGNDAINIEGRLSVGKDFAVELGGGTEDLIYSYNRGLSIKVGGSFRVHGTADSTTVALGLAPNGDRVRPNDNPDTTNIREPDMPLALRDLRIGRDLIFSGGGQFNALLLSAANTTIGGKVIGTATAPGGNLDYFQANDGPVRITGGVQVQAGGGSSVFLEGFTINVGGAINMIGGTGADSFTAFSTTTMKLPKTTLNFGEGASKTEINGNDVWSLGGNLAITAGMGDDLLAISGPGKVTGSVTGDFGGGMAEAGLSGGSFGRMSVGPLFKVSALSDLSVFIYNSTVNGRVDVIGNGGDDLLAFDSVKVVGAVNFTGSGGLDAFYIDHTAPGLLSPSAFLGPVKADMGDSPDQVVIGRDLNSGRVTFSLAVNIRGILGETYMVASPPFVIFKKIPVVL